MFDLVGDRWSSSILFVNGTDVKRYSELQKQIPGVSKKKPSGTHKDSEPSEPSRTHTERGAEVAVRIWRT